MKERIFFYTALIVLTAPRLRAQNYIDYYNQANEAEHLFVEGNFFEAKNILKDLEQRFDRLKPLDSFYLGMIHYFDADTAEGHYYLLHSVEVGFRTSEHIQDFQRKIPSLSISKPVTRQILLLENQVSESRDKKIADTLIYFNDLYAFRDLDSTFQSRRGRQIQAQFLAFLQKNGIPNQYLYGEWIVGWIANHVSASPTDSVLYKCYRELYYNDLLKGNSGPYYYCWLTDSKLEEQEKTVYGTCRIKSTAETGKEAVLRNRKKIGLSPYFEGPGQLRPKYPNF